MWTQLCTWHVVGTHLYFRSCGSLRSDSVWSRGTQQKNNVGFLKHIVNIWVTVCNKNRFIFPYMICILNYKHGALLRRKVKSQHPSWQPWYCPIGWHEGFKMIEQLGLYIELKEGKQESKLLLHPKVCHAKCIRI